MCVLGSRWPPQCVSPSVTVCSQCLSGSQQVKGRRGPPLFTSQPHATGAAFGTQEPARQPTGARQAAHCSNALNQSLSPGPPLARESERETERREEKEKERRREERDRERRKEKESLAACLNSHLESRSRELSRFPSLSEHVQAHTQTHTLKDDRWSLPLSVWLAKCCGVSHWLPVGAGPGNS